MTHTYSTCSRIIYTVSVCATIVVRIVLNLSPGVPKDHPKGNLAMGLNVSQVAALVFSLLTNVTATTLIGVWTWYVHFAQLTSNARFLTLITHSGSTKNLLLRTLL